MTDHAPKDLDAGDGAVRSRITRILLDSREEGGAEATARLADALYPELRRVAGSLMRRERAGHTLQPTALVGEAFLRLVDQTRIQWQDRAHFLGIAARVMRQVLVDHARRHAALKRGAEMRRVTFDEGLGHGADQGIGLLALHDALERFTAVDPRGAQVVELRVFGGATVEEIALTLGVSKRTVDHDWAVARMWLARELEAPPPSLHS
jgi:RNA polymerase sigma-70 factor (ECF subfamily)